MQPAQRQRVRYSACAERIPLKIPKRAPVPQQYCPRKRRSFGKKRIAPRIQAFNHWHKRCRRMIARKAGVFDNFAHFFAREECIARHPQQSRRSTYKHYRCRALLFNMHNICRNKQKERRQQGARSAYVHTYRHPRAKAERRAHEWAKIEWIFCRVTALHGSSLLRRKLFHRPPCWQRPRFQPNRPREARQPARSSLQDSWGRRTLHIWRSPCQSPPDQP